MEIVWYGHACFRLRDRNITIVTDPYDKGLGYSLPRIKADVVTISHSHAHHNCVAWLKGEPKIIDGPGEYEVRGVFITGIPTFHDARQGTERGTNTAFLFEFDDLTICHLGDLGHVPTQSQIEVLSEADILLIPVGAVHTINAAQAAEIVSLLEPHLVIPMHYKTPALDIKLDGVRKFLKEMGVKKLAPQESLKVTRSSLPEETQVVLLDYKQ
jgi:L-ascorbate metabolism protein UlaG (beta-lactamase superfamily)